MTEASEPRVVALRSRDAVRVWPVQPSSARPRVMIQSVLARAVVVARALEITGTCRVNFRVTCVSYSEEQ